MSRTTKLAVLTALPVAVLSLCTLAQNAPSAPAPDSHPSFFGYMLKKMDSNGDGRISLDEYLAAATTRFKTIDTQNKGSVDAAQMATSAAAGARVQHRATWLVKRLDKAGAGYVTQDEFVAAASRRFARMDKAGDGKLTPDEMTARRGAHATAAQPDGDNPAGKRAQFAQKRFDKLDTNHDGFVTQDEYLAAATAMYRQFDTQGNGKVTASEIASSPKAQERLAKATQRIVKHLDTNGDGVVSENEYLAAAQKRFTRLDKNGDGFVDADEMPAHRWAHGGKPMPSGG